MAASLSNSLRSHSCKEFSQILPGTLFTSLDLLQLHVVATVDVLLHGPEVGAAGLPELSHRLHEDLGDVDTGSELEAVF